VTDETTATRRISVADAARELGITERAVRKRIAAGTMQAERNEGRWLVVVPDVPAHAAPRELPRRKSEPTPHRDLAVPPLGEPASLASPAQVAPGAPSARAEPSPAVASPASTPSGALSVPEPAATIPVEHATDLLRMIRDLQGQNLELAGQVGFLQAKLASVQDQLLLAETGDEEPELDEEPGGAVPHHRSLLDRILGR
jgi:hypothetical protein